MQDEERDKGLNYMRREAGSGRKGCNSSVIHPRKPAGNVVIIIGAWP